MSEVYKYLYVTCVYVQGFVLGSVEGQPVSSGQKCTNKEVVEIQENALTNFTRNKLLYIYMKELVQTFRKLLYQSNTLRT